MIGNIMTDHSYGTVYLLSSKSQRLVKVGITKRTVETRINEIRRLENIPDLIVEYETETYDYMNKEKEIIRIFTEISTKCNFGREYFHCDPIKAKKVVYKVTHNTFPSINQFETLINKVVSKLTDIPMSPEDDLEYLKIREINELSDKFRHSKYIEQHFFELIHNLSTAIIIMAYNDINEESDKLIIKAVTIFNLINPNNYTHIIHKIIPERYETYIYGLWVLHTNG